MTPFGLLLNLSGLSHREAGDILKVRADTLKSWVHGRRAPPPTVLDVLADLIRRQERAADEALDSIDDLVEGANPPEALEIGYPADDHEAQSLGWPCVGAWQAMAARVIAGAYVPVKLVPRGASLATAAAADALEYRPFSGKSR